MASTSKSLAQMNKSPAVGKATKRYERRRTLALAGIDDLRQQNRRSSKIRIFAFATALLVALPTIANATCGTRGGPGYRDPATGKCLSWAEFSYRCGPEVPPKECTLVPSFSNKTYCTTEEEFDEFVTQYLEE